MPAEIICILAVLCSISVIYLFLLKVCRLDRTSILIALATVNLCLAILLFYLAAEYPRAGTSKPEQPHKQLLLKY